MPDGHAVDTSYGSVRQLADLVGRPIDRVRRIFYVLPGGTVQGDRGDLELRCGDGSHRLLGVGPDGERLTIRSSEWHDPFPLPITPPENRDFVRSSGTWAAFDLTCVPPYDRLIGVVTAADPMMSADKLTGVVLRTELGDLVEVRCDGDETWVTFLADGQLP